MKLHLVGISKCGTVSLKRYLEMQGHEVVRNESMFWDGGIKKHMSEFPDYQVVFILRDPVERAWSHFWYKRHHQKGDRLEIKCDFEEALIKHPEIYTFSKYESWINEWAKAKPLILNLETYIKHVPGFPKENISPDKPKPTKEQIKLLEKFINE